MNALAHSLLSEHTAASLRLNSRKAAAAVTSSVLALSSTNDTSFCVIDRAAGQEGRTLTYKQPSPCSTTMPEVGNEPSGACMRFGNIKKRHHAAP